MAKNIHVTVKTPCIDAALDGFSNGFTFESTTATDFSNIGGVITAVTAFYNTLATGASHTVAYYLASSLDKSGAHSIINVYDITGHEDGTTHGGPAATGAFALGTSFAGPNPMPEGVSCCVNYQSTYGTTSEFGPISAIPTPPDIIADYGASSTHQGRTRPRSRDRNRLYLGPLESIAMTRDNITGRTKFTAQFQTDVLKALAALSNTITSGSDAWNLRVWSRRDAALKLPTEAWVDDRPDYQRRRSDATPGTKTFQALASV